MSSPATSYTLLIPILTAIITGILSALLTQFLTWKLGLSRFVRERRSNRVVTWYQEAHKAIYVRERTMKLIARIADQNDMEDMQRYINDNVELTRNMENAVAEAEMFGSVSTYHILEKLKKDLISIHSDHMDRAKSIHEKSPGEVCQEIARWCREEGDAMREARRLIANECRRELGIQVLPIEI